jgi:hypothetical protein
VEAVVAPPPARLPWTDYLASIGLEQFNVLSTARFDFRDLITKEQVGWINYMGGSLANQKASCGNKKHKNCICWAKPRCTGDTVSDVSIRVIRDLTKWLAAAYSTSPHEHKLRAYDLKLSYGMTKSNKPRPP